MRAARDLLRRRLFFVRKRGELFSHVRTTLHQGNLPTPSGQLLYLCNRAKVPDAFNDPMVRARVNVTEDGSQLRNELTPGARYRQISTEFDVETTISPRGYRLPYDGPRSEILFVGDSFTFGIGLADEETFASIYCQSRAVTCANLGRPGSGTVRQIDRLANALSRGYRPREVKLFILAMTSSIFPRERSVGPVGIRESRALNGFGRRLCGTPVRRSRPGVEGGEDGPSIGP